MPEHFFSKLKEKIPFEWKLAFFSSIIIGLLAHFYIFLNRLPNHDGLLNIYSSQAKVTSGRFFLGPASGMSSYFDLPWVIGLFSIVFLAFAAVATIVLFEVKKKLSIILISGLIVTFPSVSATFSYMFTADGYMLGTFFAILAIVLTKRYKFGFIFGAVLLCLGVGIYQANLSVAMAFITLWLMQDIVLNKRTLKEMGINIVRSALLLGIGMFTYLIVYKIYTSFLDVAITSYQGLDKVGTVNRSHLPDIFDKIELNLKTFFFDGFINNTNVNLLEWLNVFIVIVLVLLTITTIINNKVYLNIGKFILFVLLVLSLPISFYIVYFLSPEAEYHMLMVYSISSIYIFLILLYDAIDVKQFNVVERFASWATVLLVSVLIYNFGLIANIVYLNMEFKVERSVQLANRIVDRVEQLDNYDEIEMLHVVGRPKMETNISSVFIPQTIPRMVGSTGESIIGDTAHVQKLFENYLGYRLQFPTPEELAPINEGEFVEEMGIWPSQDSIQVVDGILVIKLSE